MGDIVGFDPVRGRVEFIAKNKLSLGDRIEPIQPAGPREFDITEIEDTDGNPIGLISSRGHRAWLRLPEDSVGAFVARFVDPPDF